MQSAESIMQLLQSLIWLLAGVSIFIVGMNFLSDALEKSAGSRMKELLEKISNNRFSGVGIGAGVTAIVQSSSATTVMIIGLVNAGVMTLVQATPIIMGANIGTTITGILISLKNDYFNMLMYLLAFVGVMLSFFKSEKAKLAGVLCSGMGMIFVGLNIMSSDQAFGNPMIESLFADVFAHIDFPPLLILTGIVFTALIQSSSAATGVVITMVGTQIMPLELALFIILGANVGTCVTALLASVGANENAKRVALIHFTFNVAGSILFAIFIWGFREPVLNLLVSIFPGSSPMSLQMRVSLFHVIFNVATTCLLLPFVKQLVAYSCRIIPEKEKREECSSLKYLDDRLLATPTIALAQVKNEIDYMISLVEENIRHSFVALQAEDAQYSSRIVENEARIDFTNSEVTKFLIKLSADVEKRAEVMIGSYFHVLNDLERIGDHAENFHEIGIEMMHKKLSFSDKARSGILDMRDTVLEMLALSRDALTNMQKDKLHELSRLEEIVDGMKKELIGSHFTRLAAGNCSVDVSPYYSSVIIGLERVADHLVNIGYSIVNPVGAEENC